MLPQRTTSIAAKKTKNGSGTAVVSKGFGAPSTASKNSGTKKGSLPSFDGPTSLRISEIAFDKYESDAAQDPDAFLFRDFIICTKIRNSETSASLAPQLSDWVPCAQLGLLSSATSALDQTVPVTHGLASLCREVVTAASMSVPSLLSRVPHAHLDYAVEPTDAWTKWVYETVIEERSKSKALEVATVSKQEAWGVLGLTEGASYKDIKKAYLKLARDLHPDALIGRDETIIKEAEIKFLKVSRAYEILGGGIGEGLIGNNNSSWYESIGGKGRTGFMTVDFSSSKMGQNCLAMEMDLELGGWRAAIRTLDSDIVQTFATRNAAAAQAQLEASRS